MALLSAQEDERLPMLVMSDAFTVSPLSACSSKVQAMGIQAFLRLLRGLTEPNMEPQSAEAYARRGDTVSARATTTGPSPTSRNPYGETQVSPRIPGRGSAYSEKGDYEKAIAEPDGGHSAQPAIRRGVLRQKQNLREDA